MTTTPDVGWTNPPGCADTVRGPPGTSVLFIIARPG
jgi:hypothetical protein